MPSNNINIKSIAVIGAGVMGAQLAALFANKGIRSYLYDITTDTATLGKDRLKIIKPPPLEQPENIELIQACSLDKDIHKIKKVDWIIEAVPEKIEIKIEVFKKISPYIHKRAILSSNTSGITLNELIKNLPANLKSRFLITHFFNPPRYMKLLEIVKNEQTSLETYNSLTSFCRSILNKGIVPAKDNPNFIGNRVGIFSLMSAIKLSIIKNIKIEEVDFLTGAICGRPKSATFRTADIIGLDTLESVAMTTYEKSKDDESIEVFKPPSIIKILIKNNYLGQKSNSGFYRKNDDGAIQVFNPEKNEYQHVQKLDLGINQNILNNENINDRLDAIINLDNKYGDFLWHSISDMLLYCANRVPEITSEPINIDNAMKWGFGWQFGPFELWQMLGLDKTVKRMQEDKKNIPNWIRDKVLKKELKFF